MAILGTTVSYGINTRTRLDTTTGTTWQIAEVQNSATGVGDPILRVELVPPSGVAAGSAQAAAIATAQLRQTFQLPLGL